MGRISDREGGQMRRRVLRHLKLVGTLTPGAGVILFVLPRGFQDLVPARIIPVVVVIVLMTYLCAFIRHVRHVLRMRPALMVVVIGMWVVLIVVGLRDRAAALS
jgi:hypothetical protein